MPARLISLRFDVDSHRCVSDGMPSLLDLAAELDVRFTFFVNFGRLTSRPRALRRLLGRPSTEADGPVRKLPLREKLGTRDLVVATARNPLAGAAHLDVVRRAIDEGHDVGLHGGRNHRVWQDDASGWSQERVADEVAWGASFLSPFGGTAGRGFSSPGWTTSDAIAEAVAEAGFAYLADRHGSDQSEVLRRVHGLLDVPTNVLGEPGGVGWLEWCRASGDGDRDLRDRFARRLEDLAGVGRAVVYDHPFHAGLADLDATGWLVEDARAAGWQVAPMADLAAAAAGGDPA